DQVVRRLLERRVAGDRSPPVRKDASDRSLERLVVVDNDSVDANLLSIRRADGATRRQQRHAVAARRLGRSPVVGILDLEKVISLPERPVAGRGALDADDVAGACRGTGGGRAAALRGGPRDL